ncbi:hypothetical protein AKJ64_03495 [candidate division MSBL1 archaeon SCGC-AAA259E17]|uniref:Uncharacterized protein n=1 Tax=candidate division MSBL1 archaeon SCGC-AAA259E17 TaxID=1698263 RepID=A0A133UDM4_9EURY|nr:hypothetical protein AKJ64_03495 [candidate division MSBL1 archaeon SCGC-AAA259E17]
MTGGFDRIEKHIEQMEAVKNYPSLKAENEGLKEQVEELRSELSKKEDRIEKLEEKEEKLERRESELKDVKEELEKTESELKDLKEIKAFRGLSLEEATEKFLESKEAEIDERSRQKFREVKEEYEEKLPQMIEKRLSEVLAKPRSEWSPKIEELVDSKAKEISNHILEERKNWPEWFKKYFQREVSSLVDEQIDEEFKARVEERSNELAEEKLEGLKTRAWPEWYSKNVEPKINTLRDKMRENALEVLKGPWKGLKCDNCGAEKEEFVLTDAGVGNLLRKGKVELECPNPDCVDHGLFGLGSFKHQFEVFIEDLIGLKTTA